MPLRRRSLLAAIALSPLAVSPADAADPVSLAVNWRTTVGDGRLLDSARIDGRTLLLTDHSDQTATLHAVADDGTSVWSRQFDDAPSPETVTGTDDGGALAAGRTETDDRVMVARLSADGALSWRHRVPVGYHDDKLGVQPLDGDRVAVVSNDITTHAVSARIQCLDSSGTVRWDHTRDGFGATITDALDGDLVTGGYAYESAFDGWFDRIDAEGQRVWEHRWTEEYTDAAGFGPGGGVAASGIYEDDGTDAWRISYLSADGRMQREWTHNFADDDRANPRAALRLADGSAVFVGDRDDSSRVRLLQTGSAGSPDTVTFEPFDAAVAPHDLFAVDGGVLLTGDFESASDGGSWVVRIAERGADATATRTDTRTTRTGTDTEVTPYPPPPTDVTETTTGDSGPGFGPLAALAGLGAASLARLRNGEKDAD
ncbi:PGF-CTERM sorting domain-containing protein [Halomicroarcula sp. S1AR25-4]|uniref:PGF-CTERM sorting domain-containing protein n=1 Tax=Haloarcula sp. S1AR25-4 TaxID=2950538 RepID=UPI002875425E|nr:PGF-CTERM sorting domain-containing protein [Halomicroarcula sp. S1AR25-4]MDS0277929.1 PGF-CTERM sorting domain-containing protein [Halomicroarcula sp. S1AR25-4]